MHVPATDAAAAIAAALAALATLVALAALASTATTVATDHNLRLQQRLEPWLVDGWRQVSLHQD